jgi:hypothetical protein
MALPVSPKGAMAEIVKASHRGADQSGRSCLRPLEHWDRGFESHSRHGCLFILDSGLAMG